MSKETRRTLRLVEQATRLLDSHKEHVDRYRRRQWAAIVAAHEAGESERKIGDAAGVSGPRVHQILEAARKEASK